MMSALGIETIHDIPGYKRVLKTVIKSQIQHLVDLLATCAEEESIILTASVADGTLSHLGSKSARSFFDGHEAVKSQFLCFCLNNHQKQQLLKADQDHHGGSPCVYNSDGLPEEPSSRQLSPKVVSPQKMGQQCTITSSRTSHQLRHEPYPIHIKKTDSCRRLLNVERRTSPVEKHKTLDRKESLKTLNKSYDSGNSFEIKVECSDEFDGTYDCIEGANAKTSEADSEEAGRSSSPNTQPSVLPSNPPESTTIDTIILTNPPYLMSSDVRGGAMITDGTDDSYVTNELQIKHEAAVEVVPVSQLEFEKELAEIQSSSVDLHTQISTESSADVKSFKKKGVVSNQQAPNQELVSGQVVGEGMSPVRVHVCDHCGKLFPSRWELGRHKRTHTGEKPYSCGICRKSFSDKSNMKQHIKGVHYKQTFRRDR